MFEVGDSVRIKPEFRNPGEADELYVIVDMNENAQRCYITPAKCTLPLAPQELVSLRVLEKQA